MFSKFLVDLKWRRIFKTHSYSESQYPSFDICSRILSRQFGLITADRVLSAYPGQIGRGGTSSECCEGVLPCNKTNQTIP